MAKGLKTNGLEEVNRLARRVRRQYSLGRIERLDAQYLESRLAECYERIKVMPEQDEDEAAIEPELEGDL